MSSLDYLESERKKLWEKIVELEGSIKKKTSDYEADAKQASKKCTEFKNKIELTQHKVTLAENKIQEVLSGIEESKVVVLIDEIQKFEAELSPRKAEIEKQISELETLFTDYEDYAENIKLLDELAKSADETSTKIDTLYKLEIDRKKDIDQLHSEIFGFKDVDATTGKETKIAGLKDKLDSSYTNLTNEFSTFSDNKNKEFKDILNGWRDDYSKVLREIEGLLPNALTAGLSHAYSQKKVDEIKERESLNKQFLRYINMLIAISIIPFGFCIFLLANSIAFDEAVYKMPRLVLSILPLYVPVLWVAISTSKKINLSKRLIEEYTHKEVVSKTFEGLSKQIENIKDLKTSATLKSNLLGNILEICAENPGKLILDYNKSDHPISESLAENFKVTDLITGALKGAVKS